MFGRVSEQEAGCLRGRREIFGRRGRNLFANFGLSVRIAPRAREGVGVRRRLAAPSRRLARPKAWAGWAGLGSAMTTTRSRVVGPDRVCGPHGQPAMLMGASRTDGMKPETADDDSALSFESKTRSCKTQKKISEWI